MTSKDKQDVIAICNILADKMSDSGKVAVQQIIGAVEDMVENEPCEDCISRKETIEWLKKVTVTDGITFKTGFEQILYDIEQMPSVTPKGVTITDFADKCRECGNIKSSITPQIRWIPVSEKIPNKYGDYLVTFRISFMNFIEVCTFNKAGWDKGGYDEVIAWMPLPKPYEESEETYEKNN